MGKDTKIDLFEDTPFAPTLTAAAESCRLVFFTGLPASGKSFLLRQQCLAAAKAGRAIHVLRWDAGLSAFLTEKNVAKYPQTDGTSHPILRYAANFWGRQAVARWHANHPVRENILIGEVPIFGNRFSDLIKPRSDSIEPLLASDKTAFIFPVPSNSLRAELEVIRRATFADPRHPDEAKDAPPATMEWALRIMNAKACDLGLVLATDVPDHDVYDATINQRFFDHLLQHRQATALSINELFPGETSAHDLLPDIVELIATPKEVAEAVAQVVELIDAGTELHDLENWYLV